MTAVIPIVDYLVLGGSPHLKAHECVNCGARYFDRRNACSRCYDDRFTTVDLPGHGTVRTFTIVSVAAPGVPVPFTAAVIDCGGTSVRANIVNCPPDPEHVRLGLPVRLTTYSLGQDKAGSEAIAFGFEPDEPTESEQR
jgi:uncharacterized OB-fold protein